MGECHLCGAEMERGLEGHKHWCQGVEDFVQAVKDGEEIEPHMGTAHQFCEALNRLRAEFDSFDAGGED